MERGGGGQLLHVFIVKNVCPLYRCPGAELSGRVNRGGNGFAGLSFSFSCTNDVVLDHSCFSVAGVQVGATADCARPGIGGMPKTRRKERRRGRIARRRNEYPYKIQLPRAARKAGYNIQLRISPQHLATGISRILMWVLCQSPTA